MLLILFILVILSTCLIFSYRTQFAYVIALYFFGCVIMVFAGLFYFIAISSYGYMSRIDYIFLQYFSKIHPGLYKSAIVHNFGAAVIMSGAIACLKLVYPCKKWIYGLMMLPVLYVFVINLPFVNWHIFIHLNAANAGSGIHILYFLKKASAFVALLYLLMPMVILGIYWFKTKIFVKKRYGLSCMACILFIYLILYLLFINGIFKPTMFYNIDLMNFPKKGALGMFGENMAIMASVLCIFAVNTFILLYFSPFKKYGSNRRFIKRSRMISENVYMLLHTYKNNFLCIQKLVSLGEDAEEAKDGAEVMEVFARIKRESGESVENISRTLKMLNAVSMEYHVFTIESCIEEALKKTGDPLIHIERNYRDTETIVLGNRAHIVESLVNIFRNSIEAIEQKEIRNGRIQIDLYTERDMLLLKITDNGCGIEKGNMHSVFKPFYTTKRKKVGNGLGLDFVKRVITIHGGDVAIKSVEGILTSIYIALPIYQNRGSKWM